MIYLGKTVRHLRATLELTQKEMANYLNISCVHLSNIENDKSIPSPSLVDRFQELWGVDLYILAWCLHGDVAKLPKPVQLAASNLVQEWKKDLNAKMSRLRKRHQK
jgi:transcriptional regulator with XRE-family HTH domain